MSIAGKQPDFVIFDELSDVDWDELLPALKITPPVTATAVPGFTVSVEYGTAIIKPTRTAVFAESRRHGKTLIADMVRKHMEDRLESDWKSLYEGQWAPEGTTPARPPEPKPDPIDEAVRQHPAFGLFA